MFKLFPCRGHCEQCWKALDWELCNAWFFTLLQRRPHLVWFRETPLKPGFRSITSLYKIFWAKSSHCLSTWVKLTDTSLNNTSPCDLFVSCCSWKTDKNCKGTAVTLSSGGTGPCRVPSRDYPGYPREAVGWRKTTYSYGQERRDLHILTLNPATLPNLFVSSSSFLMESSGLCTCEIISSMNTDSVTFSFLIQMPFLFLVSLPA